MRSFLCWQRFGSFCVALSLLAATSGCRSSGMMNLKIIAERDLERRVWAEPKLHFATNEPVLICISGYGGHSVTLELWESAKGLVGKRTNQIPAVRLARAERQAPRVNLSQMGINRVEDLRMVGTDWIVKFKRLPPGNYEVKLDPDTGARKEGRFIVEQMQA